MRFHFFKINSAAATVLGGTAMTRAAFMLTFLADGLREVWARAIFTALRAFVGQCFLARALNRKTMLGTALGPRVHSLGVAQRDDRKTCVEFHDDLPYAFRVLNMPTAMVMKETPISNPPMGVSKNSRLGTVKPGLIAPMRKPPGKSSVPMM